MGLEKLGFSVWFQDLFVKEMNKKAGTPARITAVDRDSFLIRNENGELRAELAGSFLFNVDSGMDMPCVGDWVIAQTYDDNTFAIIVDLFPRRTYLRRKSSGKSIDYQAIAANIDTAFIVQACDANLNIHRFERYLVMVNDGQVKPVILLTKSDLVNTVDLDRMVELIRKANIQCPVLCISNRTGVGLKELHEYLEPGKTYCLLGSSGVGKTTLLNHLLGEDVFDTREVRPYDSKGRHTTSRRQLTLLDNGAMLIDTPGMRELGTIGMAGGIDQSFAEAAELALECRFTDCSHTIENGCALLAALEDGRLSQERYNSYMQLDGESAFHEMTYLEKRKKDKDFGRFIKTVKKQMKK